MNGEFKQSFRKYIFCLLFIFSGSFIAIRFSLWVLKKFNQAIYRPAFSVSLLLFWDYCLASFQYLFLDSTEKRF